MRTRRSRPTLTRVLWPAHDASSPSQTEACGHRASKKPASLPPLCARAVAVGWVQGHGQEAMLQTEIYRSGVPGLFCH